jgi:hypothetical protein
MARANDSIEVLKTSAATTAPMARATRHHSTGLIRNQAPQATAAAATGRWAAKLDSLVTAWNSPRKASPNFRNHDRSDEDDRP